MLADGDLRTYPLELQTIQRDDALGIDSELRRDLVYWLAIVALGKCLSTLPQHAAVVAAAGLARIAFGLGRRRELVLRQSDGGER